eukprot:11226780-Lingulodinium_polyedra.AAC.1
MTPPNRLGPLGGSRKTARVLKGVVGSPYQDGAAPQTDARAEKRLNNASAPTQSLTNAAIKRKRVTTP